MGPIRKPHRPYTQACLDRAISFVKTDGMSIRKAAKKAGVPRTTLFDHVWGKYMGADVKYGGVRITTDEQEQSLSAYMKYISDRGFNWTRRTIRLALKHMVLKANGKSKMGKFGPSSTFVRDFVIKYDVVVGKGKSGDQDSHEKGDLKEYCTLLENTILDLELNDKPERIFYLGEIGLRGKERTRVEADIDRTRNKCNTRKSKEKTTELISDHITVNVTISADGNALPPLVVLPESYLHADIDTKVPIDWSLHFSKFGYMNKDIFLKWFTDEFVPRCGSERPVVLLMDAHVSYITEELIAAAVENDIELLCFPTYATNLLQPLHSGYFNMVKNRFVDVAMSLGYMETIPSHLFLHVLKLSMQHVPASVITEAFRLSEIHPLQMNTLATDVMATIDTTIQIMDDQMDSVLPDVKTNETLASLGLIPSDFAEIAELSTATSTTSRRSNRRKTKKVKVEDTKIIPQQSIYILPLPGEVYIPPPEPIIAKRAKKPRFKTDDLVGEDGQPKPKRKKANEKMTDEFSDVADGNLKLKRKKASKKMKDDFFDMGKDGNLKRKSEKINPETNVDGDDDSQMIQDDGSISKPKRARKKTKPKVEPEEKICEIADILANPITKSKLLKKMRLLGHVTCHKIPKSRTPAARKYKVLKLKQVQKVDIEVRRPKYMYVENADAINTQSSNAATDIASLENQVNNNGDVRIVEMRPYNDGDSGASDCD